MKQNNSNKTGRHEVRTSRGLKKSHLANEAAVQRVVVLEDDAMGKWLRKHVPQNLHARALEVWPRGPISQLRFLLDVFGRDRAVGHKSTSERTFAQRNQELFMLVKDLRGGGNKIQNLLNLGNRHIVALTKQWEERDLAPKTKISYLTNLRNLARWIGKADMIPAVKDMARINIDPKIFEVTTYATKDKSWDANVGDKETTYRRAGTLDVRFELVLRLIDGFGLRIREAACFEPHKHKHETHIAVDKGTKGGRYREVPIRNNEQRMLLQRCLEVVTDPNDSMSGKSKPLKQAMRRLRYLCEKVGMTGKGELRATMHGGRHGYAHQRFEELSGVPPPIKDPDAIAPDKEKLRHAQQTVASELGHGRRAIHTAYSGSASRKQAAQKEKRDSSLVIETPEEVCPASPQSVAADTPKTSATHIQA